MAAAQGGVEISRAADGPDIDTIAGAEVEFTLTAKDAAGNVLRNWDTKGGPTTLTIIGSTANTDTSTRPWNGDALGYTWSVITNNGQNIVQISPDAYTLPNAVFVNGVTTIRITHTKAERGIQIACTPVFVGLKQTSAKLNFRCGPVRNFMLDITSSTPMQDQVYKMRMYEIVVSPRDRYLNVSSERVKARFSSRFPAEYSTWMPGLSDIFSGNVFITGPSTYFLASKIARSKGQDELQWVACRGVADTTASGRSAPYEILDHAPGAYYLKSPVDHSLWVFLTPGPVKQVQFTWDPPIEPDPYTDIQVSRFDPRRYSDDLLYNIVLVDSISLTRAMRFESDSSGRLPRFTRTSTAMLDVIHTFSGSGWIHEYNLIWFVEATDGLYSTLSSMRNQDSTKAAGHHLFVKFDGAAGIEDMPQTFDLGQNYPNPFNPATTIPFSLPKAALVTMTVYDVLGTPVKTLLRDFMDAGAHSVHWDGRDEAGQALPSGSYVLRMAAGEHTLTRVMVLMK